MLPADPMGGGSGGASLGVIVCAGGCGAVRRNAGVCATLGTAAARCGWCGDNATVPAPYPASSGCYDVATQCCSTSEGKFGALCAGPGECCSASEQCCGGWEWFGLCCEAGGLCCVSGGAAPYATCCSPSCKNPQCGDVDNAWCQCNDPPAVVPLPGLLPPDAARSRRPLKSPRRD